MHRTFALGLFFGSPWSGLRFYVFFNSSIKILVCRGQIRNLFILFLVCPPGPENPCRAIAVNFPNLRIPALIDWNFFPLPPFFFFPFDIFFDYKFDYGLSFPFPCNPLPYGPTSLVYCSSRKRQMKDRFQEISQRSHSYAEGVTFPRPVFRLLLLPLGTKWSF